MGFIIDDLTAMTFITEGVEWGIKKSPRDIEESEDISVLRRLINGFPDRIIN